MKVRCKECILVALSMLIIPLLASCGTPATTSTQGSTAVPEVAASTAPPEVVASTAEPSGDQQTDVTTAPAALTGELTIQHSWAETNPTGVVFKTLVQNFEQQNPGIKVKQVITGVEGPEVYETAFAAGKAPEIILINLVDKPTQWLEQGATIPVTELLTDWGIKDKLLPAALEQWTTKEGQVQAFPYSGFKWPVWYNTALLEKAGVSEIPKTTDELIAAAEKLRAAGIGPLVVGGNDWSGNKLFLQLAQSYVTAEEAQSIFREGTYCDTPNARKGVELFIQLRDAKVFVDSVEGLKADEMNAMFFNGQAAIMPSGSWSFTGTPKELIESIELGGLPAPSGGTYKQPTAYQGYTASGIWISPNGQKKIDLVRTFVDYMFSPEVLATFVEQGGLIPAVKEVPLGTAEVNPLLASATNELDARVNYAVMPDTYVPGDRLEKAERATSLAFTPSATIDQICTALQDAYR